MDEAIEFLRATRDRFRARGKLLHAHITNNIIQSMQAYVRKQKAAQEVQAKAEDAQPTALRTDRHEADDSGADTQYANPVSRSADGYGAGYSN